MNSAIVSDHIARCSFVDIKLPFANRKTSKALAQYIVTWKPEEWSQNRCSFLGNNSVNTFPRQRIGKQQYSNFRCFETVL
jgi:hypothetical protein